MTSGSTTNRGWWRRELAAAETFVFSAHGDQLEIHNLTAKVEDGGSLPNSFSLSQNYPNPFNPSTTIEFALPTAAQARIEIFNILGELVATPFDGTAEAGSNTVVWDGTNQSGRQVASGVYFYRFETEQYKQTHKMILMK